MQMTARSDMPDFERWKTLAMEDPAQFEALRAQTIEALIIQAPEGTQMQLRRLQWRIDRVRERAATPLAACVELSRMMWDSFTELRETYRDVFDEEQRPRVKRSEPRKATVLSFRKPEPIDA